MTILHISSIANEKNGGVGFVVPSYIYFQSKYANVALLDIHNSYCLHSEITTYDFQKYLSISNLPNGYCNPDIVIFHEVYKKEYLKLYKECLKKNIPYIVVPHGCMTKYSQKSKWLKKKIGNIILFNDFLKKAKAIHYLSDIEKKQSYIKNKAFICGNGINITKKNLKLKVDPFTICYLGRYNVYHKGLDILLNSIKLIKDWMADNNIVLKMYGMAGKKNCNWIKKFVFKNGLENIVIINDAVYGEEKEEVFKKSSIFILTSRWEGCPQAIQEALIRGIPCIVSPGTGFAEYIQDNNCGYYTDGSIESTCKMIKKAYDNRNNLKELSENGINAMLRDFTWDNIARKNMEIYAKIINDK